MPTKKEIRVAFDNIADRRIPNDVIEAAWLTTLIRYSRLEQLGPDAIVGDIVNELLDDPTDMELAINEYAARGVFPPYSEEDVALLRDMPLETPAHGYTEEFLDKIQHLERIIKELRRLVPRI